MLHKDYYGKGSVEKKNLWSRVSRDLTPRRNDYEMIADVAYFLLSVLFRYNPGRIDIYREETVSDLTEMRSFFLFLFFFFFIGLFTYTST
jgi:hypothetical protein